MSSRMKDNATNPLWTPRNTLARLGALSGALVLGLPVVLLPLSTAVPITIWLPLLLIDVAALVLATRWLAPGAAALAAAAALLFIAALAVGASQALAATPPILGADGRPAPNSIATLEQVELNGTRQWISIRGRDASKPVLLNLGMGGPGGGGFATRTLFTGLEEHFVVVAWDEPGTGKSYGARPIESLTPQQFVDDAYALTQHLRARFGQDKIYVYGVSWTSIVGVWLVQQHPELYHAYIGNGQMVNTVENDRLGYDLALRVLDERGDTTRADALRRNGPPPYTGPDLLARYVAVFDVLNEHMHTPPYTLIVPIVPFLAPEYGLIDKVNHTRGLIESFTAVYPQLEDLDFMAQAQRLEVPVYVFAGRDDVNAMSSLVERWVAALDAPHKELIWLDGGHGLDGSNVDQFTEVMVERVLTQTQPAPEPATGEIDDPVGVAAFLDAQLAERLRVGHIAGAAVAVVKDGRLLAVRGAGFADLAEGLPVDAETTLFRTDSTGKLFVWTAVVQLAGQGRLDLDRDVNAYLDFTIPASFAEPITLRHLMNHTAGFDDLAGLAARSVDEIAPTGVWLAAHLPARVRAPGQVSAYSNYGVGLAGYVVERIAGQPFEAYAAEHIFAPLGMSRSTFVQPLPEGLADDATRNYRFVDGAFVEQPFRYLRIPATGEGHVTVTDMARFMLAHLADGDTPMLPAEALAGMHTRSFAHDPRVSGMANGFAETTQNGLRLLRHEGNLEGVSSTALFLIPSERLGVYVVFNSNGGFGPGEAFRRAFLDHFYPAPAVQPQTLSLSDEQAERLTGSYAPTRAFTTTFARVTRLLGGNYGEIRVSRAQDGTYETTGLGAGQLRWVATAPDTLRPADGRQNDVGDLIFAPADGHLPARLYIANQPYKAFERIADWDAADSQWVLIGVIELGQLVSLAVLVSTKLHDRLGLWVAPNGARIGWLLILACGLALLFPLAFALGFGDSLLYGITPRFIIVLSLPLIGLTALTIAGVYFARGWSTLSNPIRLFAAAVTLDGIAFALWLHHWNLLVPTF